MSDPSENVWIAPGAEGLIKSLGLGCVQDGWREDLPGKVINDRGDRQVLRLGLSGAGMEPRVVYLKRWRFDKASLYRHLPGKRALRYRATTEFENLQRLKTIGLCVPEPLYLAGENGPWGPVATLLLLEGLVEYEPASEWILEHRDGVEFLCKGIAHLLAVLHRHGFYYRSPGLKHFYVRKPDDAGGDIQDENLALIDVPRLDKGGSWLPAGLCRWLGADPPCPERDLSKVLLTLTEELAASQEQIEAFWSAYCAETGAISRMESLRKKVTGLARERSARRKQ